MSDKYIKEITQNIPNNELNAAYDALMNSSLNETSNYEEVSMEELNEYIEGLECQAEDLRKQLAKANERARELDRKEGLFDQYALESEVMRKALLNKDRSADDVSPSDLKQALNKFAIEQQIEGIESSIAYAEGKSHFVDVSDLQDYIEQLRKGQDK